MYLDATQFTVSGLVDELRNNAIIKAQLDLIETLKPEFSVDGNMYCYLYGKVPEAYIAGYGETPYLAMADFCRGFYNDRIKIPVHPTPTP